MDASIYRRLLRIAELTEKAADSRLSFDRFVQDVSESHDSLANTIRAAEDVRSLLDRSGYPELSGRMTEVIQGIREASDILDTFRKMYSQGKLRYGPRLPPSVWERMNVQDKSPMGAQERPRTSRPTRKVDPS